MAVLQRSSSELPTKRVVEFRLLGSKFRTGSSLGSDNFAAANRSNRRNLLLSGLRDSRGVLGYSRSEAGENLTQTLEALTRPQPQERPYSASREYQRRSLSWQRGLQLRSRLALRPAPKRVLLQVTGANLPRH